MDRDLKNAILVWLLINEDKYKEDTLERQRDCIREFNSYIFDENKKYLKDGDKVAHFIVRMNDLLFDL